MSAQSSGDNFASKRLRVSARDETTSSMKFRPASLDMAGNPFQSQRRAQQQLAIQRTPQQELSGLAAKTYAYFSTETYRLGK
jgi:hypothetical protein